VTPFSFTPNKSSQSQLRARLTILKDKLSVRIDDSRLLEAPVPESAPSIAGEPEIIETKTTRIITNPTEEELARYERDAEVSNPSSSPFPRIYISSAYTNAEPNSALSRIRVHHCSLHPQPVAFPQWPPRAIRLPSSRLRDIRR